MSDSFDDAVTGVQSQQGAPEGPASVVYEKREYPLIPEGTYKVICTKPKLRESRNEKDPPGTMKIALAWQTREASYQGDDEKDHYYLVFNRPLGIAFGERANLPKLFKKLTGQDIEKYVVEEPIKISLGNGKYKEATKLTFDHLMFENMEAEIVVSHNEYQGKMYPQIEAVMCSKAVQESNAKLLIAPVTRAEAVPAKKEEAPATAPVMPTDPSFEQKQQQTMQEARDAGFPID